MSEKTQKATPKAQRDAREKGQVAKSQDLTKLVVLIAVSECTFGMADESVSSLNRLLTLSMMRPQQPFLRTVGEVVTNGVSVLMGFVLLSVGLAILMSLAGTWMQVGFVFAPKALAVELSKLSPMGQIKQMFSMQKLSSLLLSTVKATLIAVVLYKSVMPVLGKLILLANTDLDTYWHSLMYLFRAMLRNTLGLLLVLAAVDFGMQKYFHAKKLRMSKEDIKKEHKQMEGDPHVKGHRKQLALEFLNSDPPPRAKPVEGADVLLVNPTHYAVALFYRPGQTPLPLIHCKGHDEGALELIERAKRAKIPIVQSVWLARTLHKVKTGRHIPRPTLQAVAQIYLVIRQLEEVTDQIIQVRQP